MSFFSANSAELTNIFTGMSTGQLSAALSTGASQREALARSALSRGTDQISARNYDEAANEFRRAIAYSPTLVDGYRLLEWIRATDRGRGIPAIALTGFASAQDRTRVLAAGFQAHLPKPAHPDELIATVRRALDGLRPEDP